MAKRVKQTSDTLQPETETTKTEKVKTKKQNDIPEEVVYWSIYRSGMIAYNTGDFKQQLQGGVLQLVQDQKWVKFENHYFRTTDVKIIETLDRIIAEAKAKKTLLPCMRYKDYTAPERYVTIKLGDEQITVLESEINEKVQDFLAKQKTNSEIKTI